MNPMRVGRINKDNPLAIAAEACADRLERLQPKIILANFQAPGNRVLARAIRRVQRGYSFAPLTPALREYQKMLISPIVRPFRVFLWSNPPTNHPFVSDLPLSDSDVQVKNSWQLLQDDKDASEDHVDSWCVDSSRSPVVGLMAPHFALDPRQPPHSRTTHDTGTYIVEHRRPSGSSSTPCHP
jgi:hypothetical protein